MRTIRWVVAALAATTVLTAAAASPAAAAGPVFVRVLSGYVDGDATPALTVTVGATDRGAVAYGKASPWTASPSGVVTVTTTTPSGAQTRVDVNAGSGCSITVVVVRSSPTDRTPTSLTGENCPDDRIAAGQARLELIGSTVEELGAVRFGVDGAAVRAARAREVVEVDAEIPAGRHELSVGAPDTDEVYTSVPVELEEGRTYSLFYLGGGEAPTLLTLLTDGAQAPDPPPADVPIDTGLAAVASSHGAVAAIAVSIGLGIAAVFGALDGAVADRLMPRLTGLARRSWAGTRRPVEGGRG